MTHSCGRKLIRRKNEDLNYGYMHQCGRITKNNADEKKLDIKSMIPLIWMSKIGKNKAMYYLVIYMKYIYKSKRREWIIQNTE